MHEHELYERMTSGSRLTTVGIVVLVGAFLGTCTVAASKAGSNPNAGMEIGQSPWLLLALAAGVALIAVGQTKKINARNALAERNRAAHTTLHVEQDPSAGTPFRPGVKETPVLDPTIAAIEQAERAYDHRRGGQLLAIGGVIIVVTLLGMLALIVGGSDRGAASVERSLSIMGLSVFPFGFGLFFAIKGLLLRSK